MSLGTIFDQDERGLKVSKMSNKGHRDVDVELSHAFGKQKHNSKKKRKNSDKHKFDFVDKFELRAQKKRALTEQGKTKDWKFRPQDYENFKDSSETDYR